MRAGLSVPYIANLENGRGNPTLGALSALARALGTELRVWLAEPGEGQGPAEAVPGGAGLGGVASRGGLGGVPVTPSATLARFARSERFAAETARLAGSAGRAPLAQRELMLVAMTAVAAAVPRELGQLDCHRILDAIVLASRG